MKLEKQIRVWKYLAKILPYSALATVSVVYYFGWDDVLNNVFSAILIGTITISVFWWWWIMNHLHKLAFNMINTDKNIQVVKGLFFSIKEDISKE